MTDTDMEIKVTSTLAADLANENLQLRQTVIRLRLELEEARKPPEKVPEDA